MREFYWIVEYLATFVELYMCCYFCGTFIKRGRIDEIKKKIFICTLITSGVVYSMNHIKLFSIITTFVVLLISILIQFICYRKKYIMSVGLVFVYTMILSAIDMMSVYFAANLFKKSTSYILYEQNYIRGICILLSKSILIILIMTLNKVVAQNSFIPARYMMLMGVCSAFLLISNLVLIQSEVNKSSEEISNFTMFFFIASLGIELTVFSLVYKIAEGYEQKKNNLMIELSNQMLTKSLQDTERTFELWRQSIHDYKNNILALSHFADEGNLEDIKVFLKQQREMMVNELYYIKTGNAVIDTIINTKRNIAKKDNIIFLTDINIPSDNVVSDIDIATILGNLLDNAIEASRHEKKPKINVKVTTKKNFLFINIKNRCTKDLDIENLGTSKSDSNFHGIGINSVKNTVKKYNGQIGFYKEEDYFVCQILLLNKDKKKVS